MPTPEERLAVLEEKARNDAEKDGVLWKKFDALVGKVDELITSLNTMATIAKVNELDTKINAIKETVTKLLSEHESCTRIRTETEGWLKGRFTKILDAALAGGLIILLLIILKNATVLIPMIGGGK